jgi:hypothetical protein
VIDPESSDCYASASSGQAWVLVELREAVTISEIAIQSSFKSFPRCFDLIVTRADGRIVRHQIHDADLKEKHKWERYPIGEMSVQSVRIEQKSANWEGQQFLRFHSVELFSASGKYQTGVFRSLFEDHRNEIRQFVCVTARDFDLSVTHLLSPRTNVCTLTGKRDWIEIDFRDHRLFVNGYRVGRAANAHLRSWSLLRSNDRALGLDEWTKVDSRTESREGEFGLFRVFECFGGPFRYYRLVAEGPGWDGVAKLTLRHIDFFGFLFPVHESTI